MSTVPSSRLSRLSSPPLSHAEERELLHLIQTDAPGTAAACDLLIAAHQGGIRSVSKAAPSIDADEAYAVALEAFVVAARAADTDSPHRFSTFAYAQMRKAIYAAVDDAPLIRVPPRTASRYFALMRECDGDFEAAYAKAKAGGQGISAEAMLGAWRSLSMEDIDDLADRHHDGTATPSDLRYTVDRSDEELPRETVSRLTSALTAQQSLVVGLAYGFTGDGLDDRRLRAGFRSGETMTDDQVGAVIGLGRRTVQKVRTAALAAMRAKAAADLSAEWAA